MKVTDFAAKAADPRIRRQHAWHPRLRLGRAEGEAVDPLDRPQVKKVRVEAHFQMADLCGHLRVGELSEN